MKKEILKAFRKRFHSSLNKPIHYSIFFLEVLDKPLKSTVQRIFFQFPNFLRHRISVFFYYKHHHIPSLLLLERSGLDIRSFVRVTAISKHSKYFFMVHSHVTFGLPLFAFSLIVSLYPKISCSLSISCPA